MGEGPFSGVQAGVSAPNDGRRGLRVVSAASFLPQANEQ